MRALLNQVALPLMGTYCAQRTPLKSKPLWFTAAIVDGRLDLEIELECGEKTGSNQALLQFQFDNDKLDYSSCGLSKSHRPEIGYYTYLQTQPGRNTQRVSFSIPGNSFQLLVGIRSWNEADSVNLVQLNDASRMSPTVDRRSESVVLLSVDVEALPGRAPDNYVDRLIWGGSHGPEGHGIGRFAEIFNQREVVATFYVDFAACCIHGDQGISEAAQYLVAKGQDVQLHVHSEVLVRFQQWVHAQIAIPTFALHSFSTAKRALEYAAKKYSAALGKAPDVFRAGGLWWCTDSILATKIVGIPFASNVSQTREFAPSTDVFQWENELVELPVDICLDPYIQNGCANLLKDVERILQNKTRKVVSCYMHSWSLSPRIKELHLEYSRTYQDNLEEAIDLLKTLGTTNTSSVEYLKHESQQNRLQTIPLTWADQPLNVRARPTDLAGDQCFCNICGAYLFKVKLKNDVCPHCHLRTRHRILQSIFDRQLGDVFRAKRVVANHADPNEKAAFFGKAKSVMNFDVRPLDYLDAVADVQDLSQYDDSSFDVFYSVYVLNHVTDDHKALAEMRRVLSVDGFAIIMVPFHVNAETRLHSDITQNYGKDALEKYGVGSYRYYGYNDFLSILNLFFNVQVFFGIDPITANQDAVFMCKIKRTEK